MSVPDSWTFVLLALAAYRVWRLIAQDDITETPRRWLLRLPLKWKDGDSIPKKYREKWAVFLLCPWCAGAYTSLGWWIAWQIWSHGTVVAATPFAISSVVGLVRGNLDPPEE